MKRYIYIIGLMLTLLSLGPVSASAQAVFNDTILFQIKKTRASADGFRYLIEFGTEASNERALTGKMVLNMCGCYCDSLWDAWPPPSDDVMLGGAATLSSTYSGSSVSPGTFGVGGLGRHRGVLNIWQMPGSFSLTEAFSLPVIFKVD